MTETEEQILERAKVVTQKLFEAGLIIEGGWAGFRMLVIPALAPEIQIIEMRKAFFAGAMHVFDSIMSMVDPGQEATDGDLGRMDSIYAELEIFKKEMKDELKTGTQ